MSGSIFCCSWRRQTDEPVDIDGYLHCPSCAQQVLEVRRDLPGRPPHHPSRRLDTERTPHIKGGNTHIPAVIIAFVFLVAIGAIVVTVEVPMVSAVLCIPMAIVGLFICTHLTPLDDDQLSSLAHSRRHKAIRGYYSFDRGERAVDPGFKKRMAANGSFYSIDQRLSEFPSLAAGLLKYKKHEWIIVGFERNQQVDRIWLNKGPDRARVGLGVALSSLRGLAAGSQYSGILILHNHPNSSPSLYSTAIPSARDKETASEFADELLASGVNLLEFVCERGRHHEYWRSVSDRFLPLPPFLAELKNLNGFSRMMNLLLHCERLFGI